jgi:hypothetical protein
MTGGTWLPWRAFWRAVYVLPMSPEELSIFQRHTKRDAPPAAQVAEAWMCVGRGGGKTRNAALHAVFRAITFDVATVAPGEDVVIPLLASDRRQARQGLKYVRGFNALPVVAPYVFRGTLAETCEYRTGVNVEVTTASKRAPRGYSCPTGNCDEIAWWENEDDHVNPDHEVVTALRGSLGRVAGAVLVALSNPAAPRGELYDAVQRAFGRDDPDELVWNADTLSMNGTYDRRAIARAFKRDPVVASAEFGADGFVTFRLARLALFDEDAVRKCIVVDRRELPPTPGITYLAFLDAAQGNRGGDAMTLAIGHAEGNRAVLDLIRATDPPFDPAMVLQGYAQVMHDYGCAALVGDRHALGFVQHELDALGITFTPSTLDKSGVFAELLPLVNTGRVELLDDPTLRAELLALERRSVRGGRDSIDHPRGAHDDVANVAAGVLTLASGVGAAKRGKFLAIFGANPEAGLDAVVIGGPAPPPERARRPSNRGAPHVSRAAKDCDCFQCELHRRLDAGGGYGLGVHVG